MKSEHIPVLSGLGRVNFAAKDVEDVLHTAQHFHLNLKFSIDGNIFKNGVKNGDK